MAVFHLPSHEISFSMLCFAISPFFLYSPSRSKTIRACFHKTRQNPLWQKQISNEKQIGLGRTPPLHSISLFSHIPAVPFSLIFTTGCSLFLEPRQDPQSRSPQSRGWTGSTCKKQPRFTRPLTKVAGRESGLIEHLHRGGH